MTSQEGLAEITCGIGLTFSLRKVVCYHENRTFSGEMVLPETARHYGFIKIFEVGGCCGRGRQLGTKKVSI